MKPTDIRIRDVKLYLLPVQTRVPLKFGAEVLESVTVGRAAITVERADGKTATGWGETPLSIQWIWPSSTSYTDRYDATIDFCKRLGREWASFSESGHPIELTTCFIANVLKPLLMSYNVERADKDFSLDPLPYLAGLVATSIFDIAIHDAFGRVNNIDIYKTYNAEFMSSDLGQYLTQHDDDVDFNGKFPADFLVADPPTSIPVWHLVGGLDPLDTSELTGDEPNDGYPVTLDQWIRKDGLNCLKIKLRGNDSSWDYDRIVRVRSIASKALKSVNGLAKQIYLSADFNCTVRDPEYVNEILDRLNKDHNEVYQSILYVEQPFPHDLEANQIDVHSVSERVDLFLDESAHDWKYVQLGRELGWSGVALKTCKTQTGALLSLCWARAHKMPLMVQDLTNPMLAQIPHVRLAAHAGTIMGVESNGMQFYPEASRPEQAVHPGLYQRREGRLDLSTLCGDGFGYRLEEVERFLPPAESLDS